MPYIQKDNNGGLNISKGLAWLISSLFIIAGMIANVAMTKGEVNSNIDSLQQEVRDNRNEHQMFESRISETYTQIGAINVYLEVISEDVKEIKTDIKSLK